tara:strand:+ start:198 stop:725 length:528 start_codon:yes stop_codon:yes gene_type:complete
MLKQKFYEFDKLKEAVNSVFGLDMMERTRKRPHVNARIVFSNILFERGYSKSEIGRYLNKNHATIIHYCKSFEGYVKTDKILSEKYDAARSVYQDNFDPIYNMDTVNLKNEIFSLRQKVSDLYCKIEGYKQERDNQQKDTNRMDGIFKLVSQRTHRGSEDKIMSELNAWFNGIRY